MKVQQSIQQSLVAIDLDDVPQKNETRLLQQSAINIEFWSLFTVSLFWFWIYLLIYLLYGFKTLFC